MLTFFKAKIGSPSFGSHFPVGKKFEKNAGPGVGMGVPSYAEVLREEAKVSMTKEASPVRSGDPLGNPSDTQQGTSVRGGMKCVDGVVELSAQRKKTCRVDDSDDSWQVLWKG